jgi:hypothetical protein
LASFRPLTRRIRNPVDCHLHVAADFVPVATPHARREPIHLRVVHVDRRACRGLTLGVRATSLDHSSLTIGLGCFVCLNNRREIPLGLRPLSRVAGIASE